MNGADALMREVTLDLTAMTAATTWMYNGTERSNTLGDVQLALGRALQY